MRLQLGSLLSGHKQALRVVKMIRYTVLVFTILGTAATAFATISPAPASQGLVHKNVSVFYRNNVEAKALPLVLEQCAKEDCSDTPSNS
jgi:hypothetical protein